jgi:hypothetical protein
MPNENSIDASEGLQVTEEPDGVGYSSLEGDQTGGPDRGQEGSRSQEGHPRGSVRKDTPELRNHLRYGSGARIPGTRVVDPSEILLQAFLDGNFEEAYQAAQELKAAYHEALNEAARQRYRANFGTESCNSCEGLKAGPGVLATCFQVQKCNFDSIREGSESPTQLKILSRLSLK